MISTFLYLGVFVVTAAQAAVSAPDVVGSSEQTQWIEELKSESFTTRERATKNLWRMGEASIEALKQVENSQDPEQAKRAQTIIRNITLEVDESTPPDILAAIDEYRSALSYENKELSLRTLIELQAYKQVVLLLHHESNPKFKEKLQRSQRMKRIGLFAANDAMVTEGLQGAIDILRVSPDSAQNLSALAFLLNRTGKIDAEIDSVLANETTSLSQAAWLQILYKAKGDLSALKEFALKHNDSRTLAVLSLLDGDPLPILENLKGMGQRQYRAGIGRLKGIIQRDRNALIAPKLNVKDQEEFGHLQKRQAVNIHALLGDFDSVVDALQGVDYIQLAYLRSAFPHSDDIWDELSIPFTSDEVFLNWLGDFLDDSLESGEIDEDSLQLLLIVFDTLTRTGRRELLKSSYDIYLDSVNRSGGDHIYDVIRLMVDADLGECAFDFVVSSIEDYEVILPNLVRHVFGDNKDIDFLTNEIEKEFPDWDTTQNARFLFDVLAGFCKPSDDAMTFIAELESRAKKLGGKSYLEAIQSLFYVAKAQGDYPERLRLSRIAANEAKDPKVKSEMLIESLQAAQILLDYEALLEIVAQQPDGSGSLSPLYAIAVLKTNPSEGDDLLEGILTRSLGLFRGRFQLAYQLHQTGFRERANKIFQQLLIELDPYSREFSYLVSTLCQLSENLGNQPTPQDWKGLAALRALHVAFLMDPESEPISNARMLHAHASFAHAFAMSQVNQGHLKFAVELLERTHNIYIGHGSTADHFFPSTLDSKLRKQSEKWFAATWSDIQRQIEEHPNNHDALNSAAWLAARAGRNIDAGVNYAHRALKLRENEPSYLDTLAELYYARGEFSEALKVSDHSIESLLNHARRGHSDVSVKSSNIELSRQNQKFRAALDRANKR